MFISKLGCPERKENNSITSKFRFKTAKIHELCYVLELKPQPVAILFPLFLANLDKKYQNGIEMDKK